MSGIQKLRLLLKKNPQEPEPPIVNGEAMKELLYTVQFGKSGSLGVKTEQMTKSQFLQTKANRDQFLQELKDEGLPVSEKMIAHMEVMIVEDEQVNSEE